MTATYTQRRILGDSTEDNFMLWVRRQPAWDAVPYGQALLGEKTRTALRNTPFNGSGEKIEQLLASFRPEIRKAYMDGISAVPTLARWTPDVLMIYKGKGICWPDVKDASARYPDTWSIEISSMISSVIHAWYGIPPVYVFPPSKFYDYWTCSSATLINQVYSRAFHGKSAAGSGTPFVTVPKASISQSMRVLMTEIELNGSAKIGGQLL
jgi:hypothetical protein